MDTARDRVLAIETADGRPEFRSYKIGRNAIFATPTPDRDHLAVITRGEEALVKGQVDEDPKTMAFWTSRSAMGSRNRTKLVFRL